MTETLRRKTTVGTVRDDIVRQIQGGVLRPGDALSSASKLAETYDISYVTAHRTLQQLAREGYCVRHPRRGTFVSDNPRLGGIAAVGLPAYFQSNPFHAHMIEELALRGMALGINGVVGRAERTLGFLERLDEHGIKAVIRFPGHLKTEDVNESEVWRLLQERGIATVMINDFWSDGGPFPHVYTDEAAGVSEMMDHLISLGHKRIAFVNENVEGSRFGAMAAYRNALLRHRLPYDPADVLTLCPPDWPEAGQRMAGLLLERSTAAIVIYDMYAIGILEEFKRRGVVPGRDYSLAGFDGTVEAEACGLSTVVQPVRELVSTAYSLLLPDKQRDATKIALKPTCVFRSSTGKAPGRR